MTETLRSALRGLVGLDVAAIGAVDPAGGCGLGVGGAVAAAVLEAARAVGAPWLIRGDHERVAGGQVRVAARLMDAGTEAEVGTARVEGVLDDPFGLQDRIVDAMATALRSAAEGRAATSAARAGAVLSDRPLPVSPFPDPGRAEAPAGVVEPAVSGIGSASAVSPAAIGAAARVRGAPRPRPPPGHHRAGGGRPRDPSGGAHDRTDPHRRRAQRARVSRSG